MNCDELFEAAIARKGKLTPAEQAAVDGHAKGCDECRRLLLASAGYDEAMANPASVPPAPRWLEDRVLLAASVLSDVQTLERPRVVRRRLLWAASVAASLGSGLGLGAAFLGTGTGTVVPVPIGLGGEDQAAPSHARLEVVRLLVGLGKKDEARSEVAKILADPFADTDTRTRAAAFIR